MGTFPTALYRLILLIEERKNVHRDYGRRKKCRGAADLSHHKEFSDTKAFFLLILQNYV